MSWNTEYLMMWAFPAWTTNANWKILCSKLESGASLNILTLKIPHADVLSTIIYFGPQDLPLNTPLGEWLLSYIALQLASYSLKSVSSWFLFFCNLSYSLVSWPECQIQKNVESTSIIPPFMEVHKRQDRKQHVSHWPLSESKFLRRISS